MTSGCGKITTAADVLRAWCPENQDVPSKPVVSATGGNQVQAESNINRPILLLGASVLVPHLLGCAHLVSFPAFIRNPITPSDLGGRWCGIAYLLSLAATRRHPLVNSFILRQA